MTTAENIARQESVEYALANWFAEKKQALLMPKPQGLCKEHDFQLYFQASIEIKCDERCGTTGNLFFETCNCRLDEPSGLRATTAAYWLHYIPHVGVVLIYSPKKMASYLPGSGFEFKKGCGDNNSNGYVAPLSEVRTLPFVEESIFPTA